MATNFQISGARVESLLDVLAKQDVSETNASLIISEWLLERVGRTRPTFQLRTDFPESAPGCAAALVQRSFAHLDWIDGESVVQAGETPTEAGFNRRFHAIENDLDGLIGDIATAFACLTELRKSMRSVLNEVVAEINSINAALDALTRPGNTGINPSPVFQNPQVSLPVFAGAVQFGNQEMLAWQTAQGVTLLPKFSQPSLELINPRVSSAGQLNRKFAEDANVREAFPAEVSVGDLVARFGNETLADGRRVRDVVAILPPDFTAPTLDQLVDSVAEREAGAIRSQAGTTAAVKTLLGVDFEGETAADATIDKATFIPTRAADALARVGVTNIGELSAANASKLTGLLSNAGVSVTAAELAQWQGAARTVTKLR